MSARQSLIQEMSVSLVSTQERIRLDVRNLSSNLLYASTIFNHDFIKKQIQEFDIESFLAMATLIDSEDYFLIFDLYKIFVFCTQQVLFEYSQSINQDS